MKHSFIDQYSDRDSFMHRLDPRSKFLVTWLFILAVTLTPPNRGQVFVFYLALIMVLIFLSGVPILYILRRSLVIVPFVLLVAIFLPFFKGGEAMGSYNLGWGSLTISDYRLQILANLLVKAWLSVLSLILLISTTRLSHLLEGLERLHLPRALVMILSFMYRYIFVLVDEVMRMRQARDSRNFGGKRWWQIQTVGRMVGTLFIRSYERGERVYAAMLTRGFDGHSRTLNKLSFKRADAYFGIGFSLVLALASVLSVLGG